MVISMNDEVTLCLVIVISDGKKKKLLVRVHGIVIPKIKKQQ